MRKKNNQKGQALIELIIFLPMMFTLYAVIGGFANAINGSINQQKVTRAYFYYRLQNNSTIPKPDIEATHLNWTKFGMFFIGWKDYFAAGTSPVQPCYRISIPLQASEVDKCEEKYTSQTSQFIRVGTVYGICGATYVNVGGSTYLLPNVLGFGFESVVDVASCLIQ